MGIIGIIILLLIEHYYIEERHNTEVGCKD